MRLEVNVLHDEKVRADLDRLGDRASRPQPILDRAGGLLQASIRRQFASKGGEFGGGWPPLAQSTVERKGSSEVLVDSGAMKGSMFKKVTKTQVRVGLTDFKARFHQGGTSRGLPARPVVGRSRSVENRAIDMMRDYLLRDL